LATHVARLNKESERAALAWIEAVSEFDAPDVDAPDVDTPDVDTPDVDTPDVDAPDQSHDAAR
jgi:hypothetical protein